jgi:cytoskeletal protein CcmA (bactofilin family)
MEMMARIGPSIHIKGEVTSREPLTIAGHVEGTVTVEGHALTIDAGGRVKATVTAQTMILAGTVTGSLKSEGQIVVKDTAVIEGDLSAPSVSLAEGATVHGRVDTGERKKRELSLAS